MPDRYDAATLEGLWRELHALREQALRFEQSEAGETADIPSPRVASARNLLHYLAIRQHDVRALQTRLAELGLSSLGRMEPHVLASVDAVLAALARLAGRPLSELVDLAPEDFCTGPATLAANTEALLGPRPPESLVRVMVTMPSEAATRYELVRDLVAAGMNVMRINCAHDDASAWLRMASHARAAEQELGRCCRVLCDLAGPKLRTGPVEPGPGVLHWWPLRDDTGRILARARVRVENADAASPGDGLGFPVEAALFHAIRPGDVLRFLDTRGRHRALEIARRDGEAWIGEADRNAYLLSGTLLELRRAQQVVATGRVGTLPPLEQVVRLTIGDVLEVDCSGGLGRPALLDEDGRVARPARIACTLPEVAREVRPGERIFFDDGKLGGVVRDVSPGGFRIDITHARSGKAKLRGDRGINLPDTDLRLSAFTDKDRKDLDFVVAHADLVGLSFARDPADVETLQRELAQHGGAELGVILKVETGRAFEQLPRLLLALLRSPVAGVMVARGDLGVELGFERLAEVQEEVLWLCEAAHLPVVWATQVLENLAKKGLPSRAEVTDAAMGGRAECVMLNKGPHVVEAVRFLCGVLARMQGHVVKKRSLLRELHVSHSV